jgi:hypothetical protein
VSSLIDGAVLGESYWDFPLPVRYASLDAHLAGLTVSVELVKHWDYYKPYPCVVWRGTKEQFLATKAFAEGIEAKRASGRFAAPRQLRGIVYPDGEGRFKYVIKSCFTRSKRDIKELAGEALQDGQYLKFRRSMLATCVQG